MFWCVFFFSIFFFFFVFFSISISICLSFSYNVATNWRFYSAVQGKLGVFHECHDPSRDRIRRFPKSRGRVGSGQELSCWTCHGLGRVGSDQVGSGQQVFKSHGTCRVTPTRPGQGEVTVPVKSPGQKMIRGSTGGDVPSLRDTPLAAVAPELPISSRRHRKRLHGRHDDGRAISKASSLWPRIKTRRNGIVLTCFVYVDGGAGRDGTVK